MERPYYLSQIEKKFNIHPVVAILGPRQCGKTTLANMYGELFVNRKNQCLWIKKLFNKSNPSLIDFNAP